jgi:hypothetical protein
MLQGEEEDTSPSIILKTLKKRRLRLSSSTTVTSSPNEPQENDINSQLELTESTENMNQMYNARDIVVHNENYQILSKWRTIMTICSFIAIIGLFYLIPLQINAGPEILDSCAIHVRPKTHFVLFRLALASILLCFIAIYVKHVSREGLFMIGYTISWYHVSWGFVIYLKNYLADLQCNVHPNSVSGHYHLFIFVLLTAPFMHHYLNHHHYDAKKANKPLSPRYKLFYASYVLLFVLSLACMLETYMDGYHSVRQILYGSILGIVSHYLYINVFMYIHPRKVQLCIVLTALYLIMLICNYYTHTVRKVITYNTVGIAGIFALALLF